MNDYKGPLAEENSIVTISIMATRAAVKNVKN